MKTLFIGSTRRGYLTLKALVDRGLEVAGVLSLEQDAHETERYEEPIRRLAAAHRIPLHETKRLKERDYARLIREELRPDIALAVGCRILLPPEVYRAPRLGTLAVHDSYLPEYRGFAPLNWAVINGADHTGVTLFHLDETMDGGDIVAQRRIPIGKDETAAEVYAKVVAATVALVLKAWPLLAKGTAPRRKQDLRRGSVTCSRTPSDGLIDWSRSTRAIYDLVRGLARPYPGAFTFYEGKKLMVWEARPVPRPPVYVGRIPGRVTRRSASEGFVDVLTGDGVLRVRTVGDETGKEFPAAELIRSVRVRLGLDPVLLWEELRRREGLSGSGDVPRGAGA